MSGIKVVSGIKVRCRVAPPTMLGMKLRLLSQVKPANILLDAHDSPRLCDCGLARPMQQTGGNVTLAEHSFQTGQQAGTVS